MVLLLVPPFLSCAFGLAANMVTYAGRSGWTLFNSVLVAVLNTGLCLVLIPRLGLLGAALATVIAVSAVSGLQLVELYYLEGVVIRARDVYKPHVGLLVAAVAIALLWDPAAGTTLFERIAVATSVLALYTAVLYLLRHEELIRLISGRSRTRAQTGP